MIYGVILHLGIFLISAFKLSDKFLIAVLSYLILMNLRLFTFKDGLIRKLTFFGDFIILLRGGLPFGFTLLTVWDIIESFEKSKALVISSVFFVIYVLRNNSFPNAYGFLGLLWIVLWFMSDREKKEMFERYEVLRQKNLELEEEISKFPYISRMNDELIRTRERNRISTELHDTVGHRLSAIILQLEAFYSMDNPPKEMIGELRDYAKDTLTEVRKSLRELKPEDYDRVEFLIRLQNLFNDFKRNSGLDIRFTSSKNKIPFSDAEANFLYRACEECLTNSVRHGKATKVFIHIHFADEITLTIRDNGIGAKNITEGLGLKGMQERARALLGQVNYDGENGFRVNIKIKRGVR